MMAGDDTLRAACGVVGIQHHPEASRLAYLGLYALQHRGQESAGIVSSAGQKLIRAVATGLVADIFDKAALEPLKGWRAIGHVRYSTAGGSGLTNAQPLQASTSHGVLGMEHNGNLTYAITLRNQVEASGSIFQTTADTEVILHLIARSTASSLRDAIIEALRQVEGAYSLVFCTKKELIAARDPYGVRPLALGKLGQATVIASETCAFDLIGAKYIRDVKPGELLYVNGGGIKSVMFAESQTHAHCSFENIYFSRPDGLIFGKSVYGVRKELGRQLAREAPAKAA